MFLIRLTAIIVFLFTLINSSAYCATHKVKDLILDNSDRIILIRGEGNFRPAQGATVLNSTVNPSITTMDSPRRYVVDIPNSVLIGAGRNYVVNNSSIIQNIQLSQFSSNPNKVRAVFTLKNNVDFSNFQTYTNGTDVIVKYKPSIIDNAIKYKFYTPNGDQDKNAVPQETGAILSYRDSANLVDINPILINKYLLSRVSQNTNGIILRGTGAVSLERVIYSQDNTKAEITLDNASIATALDNKTYNIPSSDPNLKATITLNKLNSKKVKLTLLSDNANDYRFIISPEGQSLFICHRSFVINTTFSANPIKATSYKITKNQNGYVIFDLSFSDSAAYNVFELNDNFYLDVNNLSDPNNEALKQALQSYYIDIQTIKISSDKTRYVIPMSNMNFSYASVESNAKSISLCFREIQSQTPVPIPLEKVTKVEDNSFIYIPIEEVEEKIEKPKKIKDKLTISSLKKVVIDPGHGGMDTGAIGDGHYEKDINLAVSKLVYDKLTKKNIHVYMTRSKDTTTSLEDRTNYSNEINPDIYVSIHVNSTTAMDPYGLETHYFKDDSIELAKIIHKNFASEKNLEKWDTKDRGMIKSRFYVINHTEAPSVLIEIGFISNAIERGKLITKKRQEEVADSITKGILEYLKVK